MNEISFRDKLALMYFETFPYPLASAFTKENETTSKKIAKEDGMTEDERLDFLTKRHITTIKELTAKAYTFADEVIEARDELPSTIEINLFGEIR